MSDDEVKQITDVYKELDSLNKKSSKRGEWSKYKGDVINRLVIYLLRKHFRGVSEMNAYIEGSPKQFDILILRDDTKPVHTFDSNVWESEDVKVIIEVKTYGSWSNPEKMEEEFKEFQSYGKLFFYITLAERKRMTNQTKEIYKEQSFILSKDGRDWKEAEREWNRFLDSISKELNS